MPNFEHFPYPCRYNTLRLLGYDYNSIVRLCAVTLVTESRYPVFADTKLAKSILGCLISEETLAHLHLRAFTLMPDHLHLIAGVLRPELNLPNLIGNFKSYTTKLYWKRSSRIFASGACKLRPEAGELRGWPLVRPEHFLKKHLWQARFFDHVIRNDHDLRENLNYIALNPVREGYVTQPYFYPYTGFLGYDGQSS